MLDALHIAYHLARARWQLDFRGPRALAAWQEQQLQRFLRQRLPQAPYYQAWIGRAFSELPIIDKSILMSEFDRLNTRGIRLQNALDIALSAERTRDFHATLGNVSVGLSSGTSGNRGVFLVSREERLQWAGVLLARVLSDHLFRRLVCPWRPALRVAFFLRANNNLYTTLSSRRLTFAYYDLTLGVEMHLPGLCAQQPDVLIAPASVLRVLAERVLDGSARFAPAKVISVAEVLEPDDAQRIRQAFRTEVHQVYQCTEGFLAYTCERGTLHLNESFLYIEREWLDTQRTRFQPIITDFSRTTQLIVRYRLNDVLRPAPAPCACGRAEQALAAVEGRADDVLWLPRLPDAGLAPIFPDVVRRAMTLVGELFSEYRLEQDGMVWRVRLASDKGDDACEQVRRELMQLCRTLGVSPPRVEFVAWQTPPADAKRRRIRCLQRPGEN